LKTWLGHAIPQWNVEGVSDSVESLLLKKESDVDGVFLPFLSMLAWYADTHSIIGNTIKEM
jgi:hypothetical protein